MLFDSLQKICAIQNNGSDYDRNGKKRKLIDFQMMFPHLFQFQLFSLDIKKSRAPKCRRGFECIIDHQLKREQWAWNKQKYTFLIKHSSLYLRFRLLSFGTARNEDEWRDREPADHTLVQLRRFSRTINQCEKCDLMRKSIIHQSP